MSTFYWISQTNSSWNLASNWSQTSGGPPGTTIPTLLDDVVLNGANGANGSCNIPYVGNSVGYAKNVTIDGYTGTLTIASYNAANYGTLQMGEYGVLNWQSGSITKQACARIQGKNLKILIAPGKVFPSVDSTITLDGDCEFIHGEDAFPLIENWFSGTGTITFTSNGANVSFRGVQAASDIILNGSNILLEGITVSGGNYGPPIRSCFQKVSLAQEGSGMVMTSRDMNINTNIASGIFLCPFEISNPFGWNFENAILEKVYNVRPDTTANMDITFYGTCIVKDCILLKAEGEVHELGNVNVYMAPGCEFTLTGDFIGESPTVTVAFAKNSTGYLKGTDDQVVDFQVVSNYGPKWLIDKPSGKLTFHKGIHRLQSLRQRDPLIPDPRSATSLILHNLQSASDTLTIEGHFPAAVVHNNHSVLFYDSGTILDTYMYEGGNNSTLSHNMTGTLRVRRGLFKNSGTISAIIEEWDETGDHHSVINIRLENHIDSFRRKAGLFSLSTNIWSENDMSQPYYKLSDQGYAYEQGTGLFLAQITTGAENQPLARDRIGSITYSVYMMDDHEPEGKEAVSGHESVELDIVQVFREYPVLDNQWQSDDLGYNFSHEPDVSVYPMFPVARRNYQVVYRISLNDRVNDIILKYRVHVI